jgi:pimeloyl-ACP methyl ester carboxylesterase
MRRVELPAGTIEYQEVGAGSAVVLAHGLTMDGAQWRHVVADLGSDFRCVLPTLPMGAHRWPTSSRPSICRASPCASTTGAGRR